MEQLSLQTTSSAELTQSGRGILADKREDCCNCCYFPLPPADLVQCPCSHQFCRECLAVMVEQAIINEPLYPVRCCRVPIPIELNNLPVSEELADRYRTRQVEITARHHIYCHWKECSAFIPPQFIQDDKAMCHDCHRITCTLCKGAFGEKCCEDDEERRAMVSLAAANG
ncbi:hypothetical protein V8C37DRAFT_396372 [Trichoderma ceciliae]